VYTPVANQRTEVIQWLSAFLPEFSLPTDSSDEALRELLSDGTVLCHIVNTLIPGVLEVDHLLLDNVGSFFLVESLC
jgi:hypothetical protein